MLNKIVDPTEDVGELDPVIMQVCSKELEVQCSSKNYVEPNDRYECLLQLIDDDRVQLHLSDDCKSHLLTLARFVEQEYSLNHKLFKYFVHNSILIIPWHILSGCAMTMLLCTVEQKRTVYKTIPVLFLMR